MLLIYSTQTSTRLQYICKFIFEEVLKTSFSITLHADSFAQHEGTKINYSDAFFENAFQVKPHTLLFEKGIAEQHISATGSRENTIFFETGGDAGFDIFAAGFYLLSCYEEYLPHEQDMYGRYAHENSIAFKAGFLDLPLINIWLSGLKSKLQSVFPEFTLAAPAFHFLPTYDIDIAWSYKEKGLLRNIGGFIKSPSLDRVTTLLGISKDPYDCYRFLDELHALNQMHPLYFFLVAKQNSTYDRHILPENPALQKLIKEHTEKYEIGLHPSWKSNEGNIILQEEKSTLEHIAEKAIIRSRQHYIKFALPDTYKNLTAAGITDDYSMGYGSINGFRASVASSYYWYDLAEEKITTLRIHPFCFMDANCFYEQKLSPEASYNELMQYYLTCKNTGGNLITIFHNNFFGSDQKFAGWKELYEKFITQLL